jgi:hypothetical protein
MPRQIASSESGIRGARELLRPEGDAENFTFRGVKQFASGAAFVQCPIVTAERHGGGWQMTLPRMESMEVASAVNHDSSFWHPLGMEASESYSIDFTGASISARDLIGAPGDFYRDPFFQGGAIRFAALQAGAILRLHHLFANWLEQTGRGGDPYQVARLGKVALGAQEAVLWIEGAAATAQKHLRSDADKLATESMIDCANMVRLSIERIASDTMRRVVAGVGAHGLLQPSRFERIIRDLTMYLRQPAPDQTLADVGRAALRKSSLRSDGAGNGLWQEVESEGSLPPSYFQPIYERSDDPWNFQTSGYESGKYNETLASLPRAQYRNALEIGCSIGVLTARLATRCSHLLSLDVSEQAISQARKRCFHLPQVTFAKMQVPRESPPGLIRSDRRIRDRVLLAIGDLSRAITLLSELQPVGAHLVLVHFTAPVPEYPLTGDQVHDVWCARPEWTVIHHKRHEG